MRRADATAATRQAVIAAARELLATVPWREFTIEAVATRAGVTRVTVYNQVRNKAGLLDAVLTELTSRAGMDQLLTASHELSPDEALAFVVERTCRFWHGERAVLRPLFGLAAVDAGIAAHLAGRENRRREQFRRLLAGQSEAVLAGQSEAVLAEQSEAVLGGQNKAMLAEHSKAVLAEHSKAVLPGHSEAVLAGVVAATSFPAYDALGVVGDDPALAAGLVLRMVHGLVSNG